jgi:hypothetical protein
VSPFLPPDGPHDGVAAGPFPNAALDLFDLIFVGFVYTDTDEFV